MSPRDHSAAGRGSSSGPSRGPLLIAGAVEGLQHLIKCPAGDWRQLLATAGLTPEDLAGPDDLVPLHAGFAVFEAVARWSKRPALGIDYAQAFALGGSGPMGFAIVNAKSVREALKTLARFVPLVSTMKSCRYQEGPEAGGLVWNYPGPASTPRLQYVSWGIATTMERIRGALPGNWRPYEVWFDCEPPAQRSAHDAYFGPGLKFRPGSNEFRFWVQSELLDRPMPEANPRLFELTQRLAEIERRRRGIYGSEFESEVRAAIANLLRQGNSATTDLAAALGLTPAQLRTKLRTHELDFRTLIDDVRRESARSYLLESDIPVTEIAFALGYTSSSIFTRACHKWFGQSPRDLRNQAAAR